MGLRTKIKKFFYTRKFSKKEYSLDIKEKNILITGANSGIGLSLTNQLLKLNNKVLATYKENCSNLEQIDNKNLTIVKYDQRQINVSENLNEIIKKKSIDIIFNCAGVFGGSYEDQQIKNLNFKKFQEVLLVNSISILNIMKIILNNKPVQKNLELLVNISSDAGSIQLNNQGNAYIYRTSKSALNSITKNMSCDLENQFKTIVFAIDPGNVKSKMNPKGYVASDECAKLIIDLISKKYKSLNGKFVNLLGEKIAW
tara:strand:+ start:834 stop:1601 length:768 start_codon:yes stop_codon:yes gene_type:complete